jgi:hypothetical protein
MSRRIALSRVSQIRRKALLQSRRLRTTSRFNRLIRNFWCKPPGPELRSVRVIMGVRSTATHTVLSPLSPRRPKFWRSAAGDAICHWGGFDVFALRFGLPNKLSPLHAKKGSAGYLLSFSPAKSKNLLRASQNRPIPILLGVRNPWGERGDRFFENQKRGKGKIFPGDSQLCFLEGSFFELKLNPFTPEVP